MKTVYEMKQAEKTTNRQIREALEGLFLEWDAYIGDDEKDGHDDAPLVGARIYELRNLVNEGNR